MVEKEKKMKKNTINNATKRLVKIKERSDTTHLYAIDLTKKQIKMIVKGYTHTKHMTRSKYCNLNNIKVSEFGKILKLYAKYFPDDKATLLKVEQKSQAVKKEISSLTGKYYSNLSDIRYLYKETQKTIENMQVLNSEKFIEAIQVLIVEMEKLLVIHMKLLKKKKKYDS